MATWVGADYVACSQSAALLHLALVAVSGTNVRRPPPMARHVINANLPYDPALDFDVTENVTFWLI